MSKRYVPGPAPLNADPWSVRELQAVSQALWKGELVAIIVVCSDETTALTTGTKVTFRSPCDFTLTGVKASLTTAATGATLLTVDVNKDGNSVLSTKLTFDASEKTTLTAATPAVINTREVLDDAEFTIDIDSVGSTVAGAGLKVTILGNVVQ